MFYSKKTYFFAIGIIVQENIAFIEQLSRLTTYIAFNKTISEQTKQPRCVKLKKTLLIYKRTLLVKNSEVS